MDTPRVSVVVVTYGHADEIGACLDAVLASRCDGRVEVVVVDNASTDGTQEILAAYEDRVRVMLLPDNVGYAAATNVGAAHCSSDLLMLLNPDCVVDPDCVEQLVRHLEVTPGVALVSALLRYPDGRPQLFARRDPTLATAWWDLTEVGHRMDARWRAGAGRRERRYVVQMEAGKLDRPLDVDCPAAACVMLWRVLAGPVVLREDLPLFFNDGDLCARLRRKGYRCQVLPTASAAHGYSTSLQRLPRPRRRAEYVAGFRVWAARWWPLRRRVGLWFLLVLDAGLCGVASVVRPGDGRLRAHARGTLGGLGLPLGARPWLTTYPGPRTRLRRTVRSLRAALRATVAATERRARRRRFVRSCRRQARLTGAQLRLRVDRTADIGRVTVDLRPGAPSELLIGPHCQLLDGVHFRLWGGSARLESNVQIRHRSYLSVKGELELGRRVVLSRGVNLHADGRMTWGFGSSAAENVTVLDTAHDFRVPVSFLDQPVRQADTHVGALAFLAAHAVVLHGVQVGDRAIIAAHSLVTRDVAPATLVGGAPARVLGAGGAQDEAGRPQVG